MCKIFRIKIFDAKFSGCSVSSIHFRSGEPPQQDTFQIKIKTYCLKQNIRPVHK